MSLQHNIYHKSTSVLTSAYFNVEIIIFTVIIRKIYQGAYQPLSKAYISS